MSLPWWKKITLKYVIQLLYLNCSVSCCTMYMYPVNEHGEYSLFYMLQSFVYNTADEANMESMDLVGRIEDRSTRKFDCNNGLVFFYIRREPHGTTSQSLFLKLSDFCVIILSHEGIYTSGYREDEQSANTVKNKNVCVQRNASTKEKQPFSRALSYHNTYVLKSKLLQIAYTPFSLKRP